MALHFDLKAIIDREGQDYVYPLIGDSEEDRALHGSIDCLIWATIFIGMPKITEDNWPTFAARLRAWELAVGPISSNRKPQTVETIRRCIGLKTNATSYTLAEFQKNLGKAALAEGKRQTERETKQHAEGEQ